MSTQSPSNQITAQPGTGEMARLLSERDWSSSPLGPMAAWPTSLQVTLQLMLASPLIASIACGPERILLYNDAAARLYGDRHPLALGRPLAETFPEGYAQVASLYDRVFAGESVHVPAKPLNLFGAGDNHVFDAYLAPIRDNAGQVAYAFMTGFDISQRLRAEAQRDQEIRRRQESEDHLRLALDVAQVETWTWALPHHSNRVSLSSAVISKLLAGPFSKVSKAPRGTIHPDDRSRIAAEVKIGITGREAFSLHYRLIDSQGSVRFVASKAQVFPNEVFPNGAGASCRLVGTNRDVTVERLAEIERQEFGKRQVFLLRLSDSLRPLVKAAEIKKVASRILCKELRANRAFYAEVDGDDWLIADSYEQDIKPQAEGRHPIEQFGQWVWDLFRAGQRLVLRDLHTDVRFQPSQRAAHEAYRILGAVAVPLLKEGTLVAILVVHSAIPRDWSEHELGLVEETAERTWAAVERAHAEATLRASEERHRAELEREVRERTAELQQSRDLLRATMDSSTDMIQVFEAVRDQQGEIIDFRWLLNNHAFESQYGEVRGERLLDRNPGVVQEGIFDAFKRVVETGEPVVAEHHYVHEQFDGWFYQSAVKLGDGVATTTKDITEWKQVQENVLRLQGELFEAKLRESEQNLRGVANIVPDLLWYSNPDGSTAWYNDRWLEYTGQTFTQATNWGWIDAIHPDDREASSLRFREAFEQSKSLQQEHRIRRHDGAYRWFLVRAEPRHDEQGCITRMYGAATDIDDQRTALEALSRSEERLRRAVAIETVGILFFRLNGQIHDANQAFQRMCGYSLNELTRLVDWTRLTPPQYLSSTHRAAVELAELGEAVPYEKELIRPDGSRWWGLSALTRLSGSGAESECVEFIIDITERKRAEATQREAEERQRFLLTFSDSLRAELDADAVSERAIRMLAEQMQLDRCYLATYSLDDDRADITHQVGADRVPPMPNTIRLSDFPKAFQLTLDQTLVIEDVFADGRLSEADGQNILSLGMRALIAPTLRKGAHRPLWVIVAVSAHPRHWTRGEIALVEEVAERTWTAIDRACVEAALRESEERFRLLVDNVQEYALFQADLDGNLTSWNPGAERLFGYPSADILGQSMGRLLTPEDHQLGVLAQELNSIEAGQRLTDARWVLRRDGRRFWAQGVTEPVRDLTGKIRGAAKVLRDETDRKRAEERQQLLIEELNHRVKNTLATVQALASQTLRSTTDPEEFSARFQQRLQALARAHNLLTRSSWEGAEVGELVREQLELQGDSGRVRSEGPLAFLDAQSSLALALVLHELGTNARKYGALSGPEGRLSVTWQIRMNGADGKLQLDWLEREGPVVRAPQRRGFGTTLINMSLRSVEGTTSLQFDPEGVYCRLEIPLSSGPGEGISRRDIQLT